MNVFERARCLPQTKNPEVVESVCGICAINVVFDLPEWASEERFDEWTTTVYGLGHAYEGQYKGQEHCNVLSEGLFAIKVPGIDIEVMETCLMNGGYASVTVSFPCDPCEIPRQTKLFQKELMRFLDKIDKEIIDESR